jgi:hypothetical protein
VSEAVKVPKPRQGIPIELVLHEKSPILPDAEEEHATAATINKWIALADIALRKNKDRDAA